LRKFYLMSKKMRQKKVSKRKYVNSKLKENKNEAEKDIHVPDNVKVLPIVGATYALIVFQKYIILT